MALRSHSGYAWRMTLVAEPATTTVILDHLPEAVLQASAEQLHGLLPSASLVYLQGDTDPPLFVSVLQHGNEHTGWQALQAYLQQTPRLPRSLVIFFGNLDAAREGKRYLPGQQDFNRSWPGTDNPEHPSARQLAAVYQTLEQIAPLAAVDFHNNTGSNPHYSVVSSTDSAVLQMAAAFSDLALYFQYPRGVQSMALQQLCPAITVECGLAGSKDLVAECHDFLARALHQPFDLSMQAPPMRLFEMAASIRLTTEADFAFGEPAKLNFRPDLDQLNFCELPAGTALGMATELSGLRFYDQTGELVANQWLALHGQQLVTRLPLMPAMLSTRKEVVRQDCLGYLLRPMQTA